MRSPAGLMRWFIFPIMGVACAPAAPTTPVAGAPSSSAAAEPVGPPAAGWEGGDWGKFHSKRFDLWLRLPDGKGWKIDDHTGSWLLATHAATSSTLRVQMFRESHALNKDKCMARGLQADPTLPKEDPAKLIESSNDVLPGWDAHGFSLVRGHGAAQKGAVTLEGQYLAAAANIRRCLVIHYTTKQIGHGAEAVVGLRLADVTSIVRTLTFEDERLGPARVPPPTR